MFALFGVLFVELFDVVSWVCGVVDCKGHGVVGVSAKFYGRRMVRQNPDCYMPNDSISLVTGIESIRLHQTMDFSIDRGVVKWINNSYT